MTECMIYITTNSEEEAEIIGRNLVTRKLAACVNIIANMKSIYHWEGKIESNEEVILIAKTKKALIDEIIENVKTLHSYQCPCIIAIPIIGGNDDFIKWIRNETK